MYVCLLFIVLIDMIWYDIRLRRTCEEDQCGPGVRMALHYDRFYCGKCHLTIKIPKQNRVVPGK